MPNYNKFIRLEWRRRRRRRWRRRRKSKEETVTKCNHIRSMHNLHNQSFINATLCRRYVCCMLRVDAFVCVRPSKLFRRCTRTKPHTIQMPHNKGETNWVQLQLGLPFEILIAKEWMVSEVDGRWIYDARCCRLIASCKIACFRKINWTFRIMTVLIRFVQLNWSLPIGDGLSCGGDAINSVWQLSDTVQLWAVNWIYYFWWDEPHLIQWHRKQYRDVFETMCECMLCRAESCRPVCVVYVCIAVALRTT